MQTLSYGQKLPETGDRGNIWFAALEDNIERTDAHDHDGTDSAAIPIQNLTKGTGTITSGSWSSQGGGRYRQEVTLPSGFTYANTQIRLVLTSTSETIIPTIEVGSASNKYYVYVNDNTLNLTALYV